MLEAIGRVISGSASKDAIRSGIMREEFRLDVGIDEESAFHLLPEGNAFLCERNIEFHREGGRREHQAP